MKQKPGREIFGQHHSAGWPAAFTPWENKHKKAHYPFDSMEVKIGTTGRIKDIYFSEYNLSHVSQINI